MINRISLKNYFDTEREPIDYIKKYEENINFFNNLSKTGRKEDLEYLLDIKLLYYAVPLNETGNYHKALKVLSEIETDLGKLRGQSKFYDIYIDSLLFHRGVSYGKLKKYGRSNQEFKKHLEIKPKSEVAIEWYKMNIINRNKRISNYILYIGLIVYLLLKHIINDIVDFDNMRTIQWTVLIFSFLSIPTVYILNKIIKKKEIIFKKANT